MSFAGRLETLELSALLQTLGAGNSSGRLTLTRLDRHAVIVFRQGRVVYAAGGARQEPLAGRLLRQGLVSEPDLMAALEHQHDGSKFRPLGDVLAEKGLLAVGTLRTVVRQRLQELVGELLSWKAGYFRFEPTPAEPTGNLEVDMGDFVVPDGIAPMELLMHAMTTIESPAGTPAAAHDTAPAAEGSERITHDTAPAADVVAGAALPMPEPDRSPTLSESGSYTADFSGEVVLLLLRMASQILARAVVFSVEGDWAHGVGEFGLKIPGQSAAKVVGETVISLREPSFLQAAVQTRGPHVGAFEPTRLNLKMVKRLGGVLPRQAVAIPLITDGIVRLILYGDNGSETRPVGPLDILEGAVSRATRILERTMASRDRAQRRTNTTS